MIYKKVITEKMDSIAQALYEHLDSSFYLAGGTAIALRLGHRVSVDLDYFTQKKIDTIQLKNIILTLYPTAVFTYEEVNILWCVISELKCSFVSRKLPLLEDASHEGYFRLAGISDLTVMKLQAILGRDEYKDYFDLACLTEVSDVRNWISWWNTVAPQSDPIAWISALSYVQKVEESPLKTFVVMDKKEVEKRLLSAVVEITSFL